MHVCMHVCVVQIHSVPQCLGLKEMSGCDSSFGQAESLGMAGAQPAGGPNMDRLVQQLTDQVNADQALAISTNGYHM